MKHFDVIIIGGGPVGSTAATFLAQKNHRVLLLEKEKFPREHVGESLIPASYKILNKLDLIDKLKKIAPRKPGVNFIANDGKTQSLWCFKNVVKDPSYLSFHVKRSEFDLLLLDNCKANGVSVLEEHRVKDVDLKSNDMVTVSSENNLNEVVKHSCNFIIDASGQSTFLGSKMGIKKAISDLDRVALFTHWQNTNYDSILREGAIKIIYLEGTEKKGWIWVIPISKDCLSIGIVVNNAYLKKEKAKLISTSNNWKEALYLNEIKNCLALKEILKDSTTQHNIQIIGDYSYNCGTKYGKNYAMIGDAAAFLDPIFSSGIFVGMHSAELIAEAVSDILYNHAFKKLDNAYMEINGAVGLLEKFIKLFYSSENINFSEMGNTEKLLQFKESEKIYTIFHFLLAGDFFENHEKYSIFLDMMLEPKNFDKFQNLINHSKSYEQNLTCGESYNHMYDESEHEIIFNLDDFMKTTE